MSLTLLVDVREKALISELTRAGVSFTVANLDVGDITIQSEDGAPLLVAERKSLADFAASNTDGRYREQRGRLLAVKGGGAAVLYFLEGRWTGDLGAMHGFRTTEELLKRLTTRLTLRYGLPVLMSANVAETAQWCQLLIRQLTEDRAVFSQEAGAITAMGTFTEAISAVKRDNRTAGSITAGILSVIPGLGGKRAVALAASHSIADLVVLGAKEIGNLVVSGKRLGEKLGHTVWSALHGSHSA
jgi:ERCC4-type nuclease